MNQLCPSVDFDVQMDNKTFTLTCTAIKKPNMRPYYQKGFNLNCVDLITTEFTFFGSNKVCNGDAKVKSDGQLSFVG
eukprot:Pgem_evm1s20191